MSNVECRINRIKEESKMTFKNQKSKSKVKCRKSKVEFKKSQRYYLHLWCCLKSKKVLLLCKLYIPVNVWFGLRRVFDLYQYFPKLNQCKDVCQYFHPYFSWKYFTLNYYRFRDDTRGANHFAVTLWFRIMLQREGRSWSWGSCCISDPPWWHSHLCNSDGGGGKDWPKWIFFVFTPKSCVVAQYKTSHLKVVKFLLKKPNWPTFFLFPHCRAKKSCRKLKLRVFKPIRKKKQLKKN